MIATRKELTGKDAGTRDDAVTKDEVYIVRIYRKDAQDHELLVGTVEDIARNHRGAFKSRQELVDLLTGFGDGK